MEDNQTKVIERYLEPFDIDRRREEVKALTATTGTHWRKHLIEKYPEFFDSANGVEILNNVRKGVAGLKPTVLVIECLKRALPPEHHLIDSQKLVVPQATTP